MGNEHLLQKHLNPILRVLNRQRDEEQPVPQDPRLPIQDSEEHEM